MFSSERLDGTAARARLHAVIPRWVPTEADIDDVRDEPLAVTATGATVEGRRPRHGLPERPPTVWRVSGSTVRGLVSLALAATAGALVMVIVGWPRGAAAPVEPTAIAVDGASTPQSVLVQPSATATSTGAVVVDVDGAVRRPGVVELPEGSRVVDALKAVGGVKPNGDTGALNLAQTLIDGEQVVVPRQGAAPPLTDPSDPAGTIAGTPPTGALIDLNTATAAELEVLPGIGPVLAAAIVDWRTQNGGFTSIDQLEEVSGIGAATYADLAPLVRV